MIMKTIKELKNLIEGHDCKLSQNDGCTCHDLREELKKKEEHVEEVVQGFAHNMEKADYTQFDAEVDLRELLTNSL